MQNMTRHNKEESIDYRGYESKKGRTMERTEYWKYMITKMILKARKKGNRINIFPMPPPKERKTKSSSQTARSLIFHPSVSKVLLKTI